MLTYQDREVFKTQIKNKEREYFKKKNELEQLKEDIIWNIDEYEKMFGQTDNFDRMKREKFYPNGTQYMQQMPIQKNDHLDTKSQLIIAIAVIIMITLWISL